MAYPIIQTGTIVTATGSTANPSLTPAVTNTINAGNFVIAFLAIRNVGAAASCSVTPPAGWTLLTSSVPSSAGVSIFVYYNSGITTTSYTFTFANASTSGNRSYAQILEMTGINLTNPMSGSASFVQGTSSNTTTVTSNSITAGKAGLFPIGIFGAAGGTQVTGIGAGWTQISITQNSTGNAGNYESQYGALTTNGQSVSASVTPPVGGSGVYNFGVFFLQFAGPYLRQNGTINSANASAANSISATPTLTNAPLSSSVVFLFISAQLGTTGATLTLPSGWTLGGSRDHADGFIAVAWNTGITGTSYTTTLTLSGQCYTINAALVEMASVNTSGPISGSVSTNPAATGSESDTNIITAGANNLCPVAWLNALVGASSNGFTRGWSQLANGSSGVVTKPSSLEVQLGPLVNNAGTSIASATWATSQANNNGIFFIAPPATMIYPSLIPSRTMRGLILPIV